MPLFPHCDDIFQLHLSSCMIDEVNYLNITFTADVRTETERTLFIVNYTNFFQMCELLLLQIAETDALKLKSVTVY